MNVHTFKDVVKSKRSSLANELDDGEDDDNDRLAAPLRRAVEGEEDEGEDKFNEAGEVLEAFNLRDERDGGHFDENMNYVFKKEKGEIDAWVAEMDEVTMEQAIGEAARAVKRKAAEREKEEEREAQKAFIPSIQLKRELLFYMKPKETVSAAMRRLSGKNDDKDKGAGIVRRRAPPSADADTTGVAVQTSQQKQREKLQQQRDARAHQAAINRVSEVADELVTRGLTGVYSMNYEALRASTLTWEYKGMDGQVYGPFTAQQLAGWKAQGFFAGPTAVQVRPVGENHASDSQPVGDVKAHADPAAAAALRAFGATAAVDNDSIYDDDVPVAAPAKTVVQEEWRSSDDVNFGEYVNLDQAQESLRQPQRKQARSAPASAHSRIERTLGAVDAALSGERAAAAARRGATAEEDGSDGEDSQPEAEGFGYRKGKSAGRKTKDLPDSDEDE